jgi:hypothetical protein
MDAQCLMIAFDESDPRLEFSVGEDRLRRGQSLASLYEEFGGEEGQVSDPNGVTYEVTLAPLRAADPQRTHVVFMFRRAPRGHEANEILETLPRGIRDVLQDARRNAPDSNDEGARHDQRDDVQERLSRFGPSGLGPLAERAFRRAVQITGNCFFVDHTHPGR